MGPAWGSDGEEHSAERGGRSSRALQRYLARSEEEPHFWEHLCRRNVVILVPALQFRSTD